MFRISVEDLIYRRDRRPELRVRGHARLRGSRPSAMGEVAGLGQTLSADLSPGWMQGPPPARCGTVTCPPVCASFSPTGRASARSMPERSWCSGRRCTTLARRWRASRRRTRKRSRLPGVSTRLRQAGGKASRARSYGSQMSRIISPSSVGAAANRSIAASATSLSAPRSSSVSTRTPVAGTPHPSSCPWRTRSSAAVRMSGIAPSQRLVLFLQHAHRCRD
jgi:hypothetical protein